MCDFIGLTNKKNKTKNYRFTSPNQNVDIGDFFFHAHETGKPKFEGARKQKKIERKRFLVRRKQVVVLSFARRKQNTMFRPSRKQPILDFRAQKTGKPFFLGDQRNHETIF